MGSGGDSGGIVDGSFRRNLLFIFVRAKTAILNVLRKGRKQ